MVEMLFKPTEGDYIVVGNWYTTSAVTNEKSAFIARYSELGDLIWIERYGGECDEDVFLFRGSKAGWWFYCSW